jgi:hypothetical protein
MTDATDNATAKAISGTIAKLLQAPTSMAAALAGTLSQRTFASGCDIPAPCWEPRHAGTCAFEMTPGGTASIRVRVSNCGWSRQVVAITALGKMAGWMTLSPTALFLDPQETDTLTVTLHLPQTVQPGQHFSAPVIIRGCIDHFVRVEISVGECSGNRSCDVMVKDCADNIHHWYDHFYCARPCRNVRTPGAGGVKDG